MTKSGSIVLFLCSYMISIIIGQLLKWDRLGRTTNWLWSSDWRMVKWSIQRMWIQHWSWYLHLHCIISFEGRNSLLCQGEKRICLDSKWLHHSFPPHMSEIPFSSGYLLEDLMCIWTSNFHLCWFIVQVTSVNVFKSLLYIFSVCFDFM